MVKSNVFEALGAAMIAAGFTLWLGAAAGLMVAGVAFVVKAVAFDAGES